MLITISGKAGSGKGIISKLIAKKMNFERISIGDIKRDLAKKMGINIAEFNILGEQNPQEYDLKYEDYQKTLDTNKDIVLESRLSFYCQPNAFKILLDIDLDEAAKRIWGANRETDKYGSLEEVKKETKKRNENDQDRFIRLYDIDCFDSQNFDLVIDTTNKTPDEILNIIQNSYKIFLTSKNII